MEKTLDFLRDLKNNNTTAWVHLNKDNFEQAKSQILKLTESLYPQLLQFDNKLNPKTESKKFIMRLNRDVRFGVNKDPYKTNFGIWITPLAGKGNEPAYYLHIEPGESKLCIAFWSPDATGLGLMRSFIQSNFERFEQIIGEKSFMERFQFDFVKTLKKLPKGYAPPQPAEAYLKLTSYEVVMPIVDKELSSVDFVKHAVDAFHQAFPLLSFFREALIK